MTTTSGFVLSSQPGETPCRLPWWAAFRTVRFGTPRSNLYKKMQAYNIAREEP